MADRLAHLPHLTVPSFADRDPRVPVAAAAHLHELDVGRPVRRPSMTIPSRAVRCRVDRGPRARALHSRATAWRGCVSRAARSPSFVRTRSPSESKSRRPTGDSSRASPVEQVDDGGTLLRIGARGDVSRWFVEKDVETAVLRLTRRPSTRMSSPGDPLWSRVHHRLPVDGDPSIGVHSRRAARRRRPARESSAGVPGRPFPIRYVP